MACGYRWIGLDVENRSCPQAGLVLYGGKHYPFRTGSMAALFSSQVLEHIATPEIFFAESLRVLEPGGLLLGSSSFLEPQHDRCTYCHFSATGLVALLKKSGFTHIEVTAGIHGPTLQTRSVWGAAVARCTGPFVWLLWQGRFAAWQLCKAFRIIESEETLPEYKRRKALEFAGQIIWRARKPS